MSWKIVASFLQNIFIPLVTVCTATMVAWLNHSVSQVDQDLKEQIASVDIALKESRDEREKINAEREFNFRIYDLVLQSLEEDNEKKQEVAKQFVLVMVDGELRERLLGVLQAGGTPSIQLETAQVIAQERVFESQQREVLRVTRKDKPSFDWEDWDYDIFWCETSGVEAKAQAELIKEELERQGAEGRIRIRELYASVNARTSYKISGYTIRRSDNEIDQANALLKLSEEVLSSAGFPSKFETQATSKNSKWYISAFICP